MKSKKILFGSIVASMSIVAPVSMLVACGPRSSGSEYSGNKAFDTSLVLSNNAKIWYVSDGGNVFDKGFNESSLEGLAKYGKIAAVRNLTSSYNYFPSVQNQITDGYKSALRGGAELVLGSGYGHFSTAPDYFKAGKEGENVQFIGIDNDFSNLNNDNLASIVFPTQKAGYLAGLYAVDYLNNHKDEFSAPEGGKYQVATFGGAKYDAVLTWMDGFKKGVEDADANLKSGMIPAEMVYVSGNKPSESDFSNDNFAYPSNKVSTMSTELFKKGVDIIFPAAGGQIKQTLDDIKNSGAKVKIIGVDGDQFQSIGNPNIIGSALKNLSEATKQSLFDYYIAKSTNNLESFKNEYVKKPHIGSIGFVNIYQSQWDARSASVFNNGSSLDHNLIDWDDSIKTIGWSK